MEQRFVIAIARTTAWCSTPYAVLAVRTSRFGPVMRLSVVSTGNTTMNLHARPYRDTTDLAHMRHLLMAGHQANISASYMHPG
jgi:hypothetical protein